MNPAGRQHHPLSPSEFSSSFLSEATHATAATDIMREIVHMQAGQCGNQIGAKVKSENAHKSVNSHSLNGRSFTRLFVQASPLTVTVLGRQKVSL